MRISDWSSDVCSSDLRCEKADRGRNPKEGYRKQCDAIDAEHALCRNARAAGSGLTVDFEQTHAPDEPGNGIGITVQVKLVAWFDGHRAERSFQPCGAVAGGDHAHAPVALHLDFVKALADQSREIGRAHV